MSELDWDWYVIAHTLAWRLAPEGFVMNRKDLASLPADRVFVEERSADAIHLRWLALTEAKRLQERLVKYNQPKAGVSHLEGRWMKFAVVLSWMRARDGITLRQADRDAVPKLLMLYAEGHAQDVEFRFMPERDAKAMQRQYRERDGQIITEVGGCRALGDRAQHRRSRFTLRFFAYPPAERVNVLVAGRRRGRRNCELLD